LVFHYQLITAVKGAKQPLVIYLIPVKIK